MKLLIVGGGGREHALAWKLAHDSMKPELFCAPGNAGTADIAVNLPLAADDLDGLTTWALRERPDLVVIGPEVPLCAGLADRLAAHGIAAFGPCAAAAQIEGSKVFSADLMRACGVPAARSQAFTDAAQALAYAETLGAPIVVKAEGLAAGKGVTVCETIDQATLAIRQALVDRAFGAAGERILIEEFLQGEEASILALVDGRRAVMLASSQDHKRVNDGDQGPNTGGMGAYSPAPVVSDALWPRIEREVFQPILKGLDQRGIVYRGILYAGLMIASDGTPRVLEFNCRFGDPETQAILPRLQGDLTPVLLACANGSLDPNALRWRPEACVCVVMTAGGYPGAYSKGDVITGLEQAAGHPGIHVFHAGTTRRNGTTFTAGGRVLGISALGETLQAAADNAYRAVGEISFKNAHYRHDIAARALGIQPAAVIQSQKNCLHQTKREETSK